MKTLPLTGSTIFGEAAEAHNGKHKVSERALLSLTMLGVSLGALTIASLGGAGLLLYIFSADSLPGMSTAVIVIGLAYLVGWLTALIAIRVYRNLVLPIVLHTYAWGYLFALCVLCMRIMLKLSTQSYLPPDLLPGPQYNLQSDSFHYFVYLMSVAAGLGALVGLHLIIDGHNLRLFSIPLLAMSLCQLGSMVYRYIFTHPLAQSSFLWRDLFYFFQLTAFSVLMLAYVRILTPLRNRLTSYFDKNCVILWSEE